MKEFQHTDALKPKTSTHEEETQNITEQFDEFRQSEKLLELITRLAEERELDIPDPTESEESFMKALQVTFDLRKGKPREELEGGDLSTEAKELVEELIDRYDLRHDTEPVNPNFDATLILGGAGITPLTRLEYALELEEKGKLKSPLLIMVGGERPVPEVEIERTKTGELARTGALFDLSEKNVTTEFDLMRETASMKLGIKDDEWEYFEGDEPTIPHDKGFLTTYRVARAFKDGQQVIVTSAPMLDEKRYSDHDPTKPRNRANTVDSLLMISEMMGLENGRVCAVTNAVFTRFQGADVKKAMAPYNIETETVGMTREHSNLPEWQNGDIGYYIQELLSTIKSTKHARDRLKNTPEIKYPDHEHLMRTLRARYELALLRGQDKDDHQAEIDALDEQLNGFTTEQLMYSFGAPVPSFDALREKKKDGYAHLDIDTSDERHDEPLVSLDEYGVPNRAFYSRENDFTDVIEEVPPRLRARRSVAEKLAAINEMLHIPAIERAMRESFGYEVELYVEDAVRSLKLQAHLSETVFPQHFRALGHSDEEAKEKAGSLIAPANASSPHAASAVDVILRKRTEDTLDYIPGSKLDYFHDDGDPTPIVHPDYLEPSAPSTEASATQGGSDPYSSILEMAQQAYNSNAEYTPSTDYQTIAQVNRRLLHNIITGKAFGVDTEFTQNPTEYFHSDYGNKLWALSTGKQAFYGPIKQ